jgi:hypothetical protein
MPGPSGGEDSLHGLFKGIADALAESGLPSGLASPELLARLARSNRALLQHYQDFLTQHTGDDSAAQQQQQELAKATLACWLEMGRAFRIYRDSMIGAQSALVSRYLELLDPGAGDPDAPKD